jgi:predicted alpha/beta superfamily hydrolase
MLVLGMGLWLGACLQAQISVEFRLHAPSLSDTAAVYIVGNDLQLGNWDPARVRMERIGDHVWMHTLSLAVPQGLEYKYTLGSWEREGLDAQGLVRPNYRLRPVADSIVHDTVLKWLDGQRPAASGQVTGELRYHRNVQPAGLPARDVVVWLPPGYAADSKRHYPVLYMHDGQNVFDPKTSSFGHDWQLDETCDSMIRAGRIAPMIVVGVYNGPDRRAEYSPGEKGVAYMAFLVHQLKPLIDSTYRTRPDRKHTYVGGSSMGGLISFMLCWEHPEVFSKAICMSPAFQFLHFDYLPYVTDDHGKRRKVQWYIDNGGQGLEIELQPGIDAMRAALEAKGYREGKAYFWVSDPEAEHFETAWAKRMPKALALLLGR